MSETGDPSLRVSNPRPAASQSSPTPRPRLVVGCMTGTSIDALDVALVIITGKGMEMRGGLAAIHSEPLGDLAPLLRRIASNEKLTATEMAEASWALGELHAEAITTALSGRSPDLICVHGQTVMHSPPSSAVSKGDATNTQARGRTWQLLQPAPIAARLNCTVVYDLRAMDVALGGQGAPITPIADWILCRSNDRTRAIVNLGGFANATMLPAGLGPDAVRGFDICACNQLLDAIARARLGSPFDKDGDAALAGTIHAEMLDALTNLLEQQARAGRSLGSGDELAVCVQRATHVSPPDLARTACEGVGGVIGRVIAQSPSRPPEEIYLAGGGSFNPVLCAAIARAAGVPCQPLDAIGVPVQAREAMCFAVLGALCQDRVPITLQSVTGVPSPAPVSGAWCFPPRSE